MYTQCPDCGTAFRVTADVLRQAAGKVRCGGCGNAFNALLYLSENRPEPQQRKVDADAERLPELRPEATAPDNDDAPIAPTLSAAQRAALLQTLEDLSGEDVQLEDTGVEWRLLGADDESSNNDNAFADDDWSDDDSGQNGIDVDEFDGDVIDFSFRGPALNPVADEDEEQEDATDPASDSGRHMDPVFADGAGDSSVDEMLDDTPTPVDEVLADAPHAMDAQDVFTGTTASEVESGEVFAGSQSRPEDVLRFDDNTGLPDNFDFDSMPEPDPVPDTPVAPVQRPEPQSLSPEIAFGDPEEWVDLLDEVETAARSEAAAALDATSEQVLFADTGAFPAADDSPADDGTQRSLTLEEELAALPDEDPDDVLAGVEAGPAPGDVPADPLEAGAEATADTDEAVESSSPADTVAELNVNLSGIYTLPPRSDATSATGEQPQVDPGDAAGSAVDGPVPAAADRDNHGQADTTAFRDMDDDAGSNDATGLNLEALTPGDDPTGAADDASDATESTADSTAIELDDEPIALSLVTETEATPADDNDAAEPVHDATAEDTPAVKAAAADGELGEDDEVVPAGVVQTDEPDMRAADDGKAWIAEDARGETDDEARDEDTVAAAETGPDEAADDVAAAETGPDEAADDVATAGAEPDVAAGDMAAAENVPEAEAQDVAAARTGSDAEAEVPAAAEPVTAHAEASDDDDPADSFPASTGELEFELEQAWQRAPDEPEFDPTRTIVPTPSKEEQTVNMLIDADLMRLALVDEDGMASTMVLEGKSAGKSGGGDSRPADDTGSPANSTPDALFETIIMEGAFARTGLEQERLAAEAKARSRDAESAAIPPEVLQENAARRRNRRLQYGLIAGVLVLALVLAGQFVHQSRAELATHPAVSKTIAPVYRAVGAPITPDWDVKGWRFEVTQGSTNAEAEDAEGLPNLTPDNEILTIYSRLGNQSGEPLPYPLISVALTDRFEEVIGNKVVEPADYLNAGVSAQELVQPGDTFEAVIAVAAPSEKAAGFKLNVCYRQDGDKLRCAIEDFM
jgi:predicted Zn finger-like uncharacterized protein